MTLRLTIGLTVLSTTVLACGPKLGGNGSDTSDLTAGPSTSASTGEESTTTTDSTSGAATTSAGTGPGPFDVGDVTGGDPPPPDLPPKGCEGLAAPGEYPEGMRSAWAYTAENGTDWRVQLSSMEPACGQSPEFPECEDSWTLNLNLPPEAQSVGLHEITDSNDVRASCSETIGGDSCAGTGGGDVQGYIEIVEITDTCLVGQVYGLAVCSSREGAFVAGRC